MLNGIFSVRALYCVAQVLPMPKSNIKHIAIAGNIGAGKTTLTTMLAKHYKWTPHFEDVDHNPYLVDFYEDMHRWSFNLQGRYA